ncbi:TetR/AcrR family transcriptional regulator [Virgibacillus litoralis]|uniref:AcrR family transcriptional regulator n=1 Tax=Virgibacillus litoralis TaxID=578221 RepID=A0ABS4H9E9_9BACI|nr:TetR/AcrR family transcriptional regulator [Virgibacillus litoralis]MBP1947526.1 AcrR family transcriptional regulator [Virgibacillus litoralis]
MSVQYPDKRVRRTIENFKTTLLSIMETKNFEDITITEIVNVADYNRGTFYAHYEQKTDLLEAIIEDMFEEMEESFRKPYRGLTEVDFKNISPNSIVLFDHFLKNKDMYKLMLSSNTNYNFREKMTDRLDQLFRGDFEFSVSEIDPNIDINLFSTYRIHGIIGLILEWIDNDFKQSPSYMGDQLIHILSFYTPKIYIKK